MIDVNPYFRIGIFCKDEESLKACFEEIIGKFKEDIPEFRSCFLSKREFKICIFKYIIITGKVLNRSERRTYFANRFYVEEYVDMDWIKSHIMVSDYSYEPYTLFTMNRKDNYSRVREIRKSDD